VSFEIERCTECGVRGSRQAIHHRQSEGPYSTVLAMQGDEGPARQWPIARHANLNFKDP
jgi:hypothetical protein